MIKKILLVLLTLLCCSIYTNAAESPRWMAQPVRVYIPEYGNFSALMKQAFNTWEDKSNSLIRFDFVERPSAAQIQVEFVDFVTNCNTNHSVGCTQLATRGRNYYQSVITIGTKEYARVYNGAVYTQKLRFRPKKNIYGVMLHEVGHAIGLGHSESAQSIMYPYDLPTLQYLTKEDIRLLYIKYH